MFTFIRSFSSVLVMISSMATLPLKLSRKEQNAILFVLWAKVLNTTQIHFEMYPVYGNKCFTAEQYTFDVRKWYMGTNLHKMRRCNQSFVSG